MKRIYKGIKRTISSIGYRTPDETPHRSRKKIFLFGSGASYGGLAISAIVGLIMVPLGLHYFGPVQWGIWLVITSILAYLHLSNFGIGAAVVTLIGQFRHPAEQRVILRRSMALLTIISITFVAVAICVWYLFPDWKSILGKIPPDVEGEAARATLAVAILFFMEFPFIVFAPAFSGLQEVHWSRIYTSLGMVMRLVALILTVIIGGDLVMLALLTGFGIIGVWIASGIHLFLAHPDIRPHLTEQAASAPSRRTIFTSGIRFFLMGIAVLVIYSTDNLVISHYLGPEKVTSYGVTFQLINTGFAIITAANLVLWPMYAQAASSGEWPWIQQTYNRACHLLAILGGLFWVGFVAFAQQFIDLWVGPAGYGGLGVIMALGGYGYILSLGNTHAILLNGLNRNRNVVFVFAAEAALNLGISIGLVGALGIGGVALGTLLAGLLTSFWFLPIDVHRQTVREVKVHIKPIARHAFGVMFPCLALALITYEYASVTWMRVAINILIVIGYLALSWHVTSPDNRNLIKSTFKDVHAQLRALKGRFI